MKPLRGPSAASYRQQAVNKEQMNKKNEQEVREDLILVKILVTNSRDKFCSNVTGRFCK